ncbi:MAG TPA: HAMP domain-containing sensor histidine kinase [Pseudonocardiaceae bacterium]|nr:HAMP domain-containing sensor histidine kinase [Pseudonocardiaceae bacterium]
MSVRTSPPSRMRTGSRRHSRLPGRSLRARVQASIMVVAALAVLLFAVPLAVAVHSIDYGQAVTALQRDATRVTAVVPEKVTVGGVPARLPAGLPADLTVGIYTTTGRLIGHRGPATSALAAAAADGLVHTGVEGADLAVSAPVPSDESVATTVRVSIPYDHVTDDTLRTWAIMALLAVGAVGLAGLVARYQGRRVAAPLERLTESARALGDGDFTIRPDRSHITEADHLAEAIEATAGRLGRLLERERAFTTQVSHQLRTPLTALLLGLESALSRPGADLRQAVATALRRGEQLHTTIEDMLQLARENPADGAAPLAVADLLDAVRDRWQAAFTERGRTLRVTYLPDLPEVRASTTAVRHVVEVLVDNALVHGAGATTVNAQAVADGLLIEVADQGPGLTDPERAFAPRTSDRAANHGIGLALARSLAHAEGGRLLLLHAAPHPVFDLLLPGTNRTSNSDVDDTHAGE